MTALKLTKRAKIAGLASMTLAATSLTVLFVSQSALASTSHHGNQPTPTSATSYTTPPTTPPTTPTCTCQETPTATPTTVTTPPTTPAPTATSTPSAPAPVAVTGSLPVTG